MKKCTFFALLFFASNLLFSQSSNEDLLKRTLQGRINDVFHKWDDEWSWDTYLDETAIITAFEESTYSNDKIVASGTFKVKRSYMGTVVVKFTAKVRVEVGKLTITNLCYEDASVSGRACCEPSKWSLDVIRF
jgi:hypothetical protein